MIRLRKQVKSRGVGAFVASRQRWLYTLLAKYKVGKKVSLVGGSYCGCEMFITRSYMSEVTYGKRSYKMPVFQLAFDMTGCLVEASPAEVKECLPDFALQTCFVYWNLSRAEKENDQKNLFKKEREDNEVSTPVVEKSVVEVTVKTVKQKREVKQKEYFSLLSIGDSNKVAVQIRK